MLPVVAILTAFAYFFGKIVIRKARNEKDILIGGFGYLFIGIALPVIGLAYALPTLYSTYSTLQGVQLNQLVNLTADLSLISHFPNLLIWIAFRVLISALTYVLTGLSGVLIEITPLLGILAITEIGPWMIKNKKKLGVKRLWIAVCFLLNSVAIFSIAHAVVNENWLELGAWTLFGIYALWTGAYVLSKQLDVQEIYWGVKGNL